MSTSVPCEEWGRKGRLWTPSLAQSGAMNPVYTVINLDTCNRLQCRSAGDGGASAHFLTGRSAGRRRSPNNNVDPRGDIS
jgi:hypothetical protein